MENDVFVFQYWCRKCPWCLCYSWNALANMPSIEAMRLFVKILEVCLLFWFVWERRLHKYLMMKNGYRKKIQRGYQKYKMLSQKRRYLFCHFIERSIYMNYRALELIVLIKISILYHKWGTVFQFVHYFKGPCEISRNWHHWKTWSVMTPLESTNWGGNILSFFSVCPKFNPLLCWYWW